MDLKTFGDVAFWIGLWAFLMLLLWISHLQYMAGHSNLFFSWRKPQDKVLLNAQLLEAQLQSLGGGLSMFAMPSTRDGKGEKDGTDGE
jgi:hypothetical protein